jgi:glycosyltransferase involved in cell wall biosynthesis
MLHPTPAELPAPLRIAMVAPPWFEVPPVGYGGIESIVADLVDHLADRGHDVTLIGAGRHRTRARRFIPVFERPPTERLGSPIPEVVHAAAVVEVLRDLEVDLVHDHTLAGPLLADGRDVPTVVTMHGPVTGELGEYYQRLGRAMSLVAISDAQRALNPRLNWVGTVHNAIEVATFPFQDRKGDHLLWLGRFCPDKGVDLAIRAARAAGFPLLLAGKCNEDEERDYFARYVEPELGPGVDYVGEADATLKRELLAQARALLFPIQWEEPFGMVMIEAMACGTPVVALGRGSVPEVVVHEETGFVVQDAADLPRAIRSVSDIDPAACRRHVEERFDLDVMAAGYERVYQGLLARDLSRAPVARTFSDDEPEPATRRADGMSVA